MGNSEFTPIVWTAKETGKVVSSWSTNLVEISAKHLWKMDLFTFFA
jgi:hypothetical protein